MWQTYMVTMVRHLSGNISEDVYTNERIRTAIVTAAIIVNTEYPFSSSYLFDIDTPDISPDPTVAANYDAEFIALVTLKAACMLQVDEMKTAAGRGGVRIADGDSVVDTTGVYRGYQDIKELGPCAAYKKLVMELSKKKSGSRGRAIVGPVTHADYNGSIRMVSTLFNSFCREF